MRVHFKAVLAAMLAVQAVSTAGTFAASTDSIKMPIDRVSLVELSNPAGRQLSESAAVDSSTLVSAHTRSATADVMNLPAEPIPTPPAFAMGMTVLLGLFGYKAVRRLRAV